MDTRTTSMKPTTKGWSANGGSVRVGTLLPMADILLGMGVDPAALLAAEGVDPKVFDDPDNQIPLTVHNRLVAQAVVRSGCPHIGLLVGQRDGLHSIGLAGLLVRYSPDVETALRSFVRYLHTHVRGAKSALTVDGDVATLNWEIYQPGVEAVDQVGDGALAVMFNILRELCGPDWKPIEVRFAHREPAQLQPFRMFFRTTLQLRRRGLLAALRLLLAAAPGGPGRPGAAARAAEGDRRHRGAPRGGLPGAGAQRAAHGAAHRACTLGPAGRPVLDAQLDAGAAPQALRRGLARAGRRMPLRSRARDARAIPGWT